MTTTAKSSTPLLLGLALLALLALPMIGDAFSVRLATRILVFAIIAMSLNFIVGYAGLVSFGHAGFVGLGAYAAGIVTLNGATSAFIAWPFAMLVAAAAGLVIGALALRTSGVYFIMITLAFAQMLFYLGVGLERYGGDDGFRVPTRNTFGPLDLNRSSVFFYVVAGLYLAVLYGSRRVVYSRFGRALRGLNDNEQRMKSLGFNTYAYKLAAFVLASAVAGLGGALNANLVGHVSPTLLNWVLSGDLLVIVILGGVGALAGPTLGAAGFILLEESLSAFTKHWMAILGALMLLVVIFHRGGLYALLARRGVPRDG